MMAFDIPTFVLMGAFIMLLCGALLIYAYFYYRDAPAALWWGVSQTILAAGVLASLTGGITNDDWLTSIAFVFFLACAGAQWHGTRLLTGAKPYLLPALLGALAMAILDFLPLGAALPAVRGMTAMALNLAYFGGALSVLVRPPAGRLYAYKPLAILFGINIAAMALAPFGGLGTTEGGIPPILSIVGVLHLESQIFVVASTFFVFAALRERKEADQRQAAGTDPLTALPNRRSFFDRSESLAAGRSSTGSPLCAVLFDLDHFKAINDRFGHAIGDEVLRIFATCARRTLRPGDVLGRIGGEEFAAVLYGCDAESAFILAERIRRAFEVASEFVDGQPVHATLSAGVATATLPADLDALLKDADDALYRAKQNGRNRVERLGDAPAEVSRVTRIA